MCKDDIKSFLFNIMKKQATMFSNISLDDETDTILVTSTDGKQFIVTVNPITADEALIEIWAKKNPKLISLALSVLNMQDLGIFTEEETDMYLFKILENADVSCFKESELIDTR